MRKIKTAWACSVCYLVHGSRSDAFKCCDPAPELRYLCPECDMDHYDEKDALECCGEEE